MKYDVIPELPAGCVTTLKELTLFMNSIAKVPATAAAFNHTNIKAFIAAEMVGKNLFGKVASIEVSVYEGSPVSTYALTETQAIAVASKLDSKRIIYVINFLKQSTENTDLPKNPAAKPDAPDNGGKSAYYNVFQGCTDVDSVALKHNLHGFQFNVLKAFVGIMLERNGQGGRHAGTTTERDCNKIIHYTHMLKQLPNKNQKDT